MIFRLSDHKDLIKSIHAGEFKINFTAAMLVLKALVSIFAEINHSIESIQADVLNVKFLDVRNFVVSYSQVDHFENLIFSAIQAPNDELFYLSPFSQ